MSRCLRGYPFLQGECSEGRGLRILVAACLIGGCVVMPVAAETEHHESDGELHRNELSAFLGATNEPGHDAQFTLGLEYERRIGKHFGTGVMLDYAGSNLRNFVVAVPIFWHPGHSWKILVAPGMELHNGTVEVIPHEKGDGAEGGVDEDEESFLLRIGLAYDLHLGRNFGLAPNINLDLVDGRSIWVYGVNLTVGW